MSELPLAEHDDKREGNAPDSQREANGPCDEFFRFRPVAYFDHLVRQADQHKEPQNKAAYYVNLACNACGEFWDSAGTRRITLGAVIISVGVVLGLLWTGRLGSNGVVAIFTIILTFATWYSWQAMRQQNKIMLRQMRQTKAIIGHMRLDQRAWLCIEEVQIIGLTGNSTVKCVVKVSNTGKTLGKIIAGTITPYDTAVEFDEEEIKSKFELQGYERQFEYLVVPGKPVNLQAYTLGGASVDFADAIHTRKRLYHVLCRFQYADIADKKYEIKGFYTFEPPGPGVFTRANYCCFP